MEKTNTEEVWVLDQTYTPETNTHEIEYIFRPFHMTVKVFISSSCEPINTLLLGSGITIGDLAGAATQYDEKDQTIKMFFHAPIRYSYLLHETIHAYIAMINFTGLPNKLDFETQELHAYSLSRFQTSIIKKLFELQLLEPITEEDYG